MNAITPLLPTHWMLPVFSWSRSRRAVIPITRAVLLVICLGSLSSCGFLFGDEGVFRDRSEDYRRAPEVPVLSVPEGKSTDKLREIYVIPDIREKVVPAGEFEVPRPTPLIGGDEAQLVRIQKLGDESWALIGLAPGQVWPQVRGFLSAAGMQVAGVDARAGLIDTTWLTLEGQPLPSRFRFRMEQGVQRGTSELHVLQMTRSATSDEWPSTSNNLAQEQEMLRAVAQFLADSADSTPVSMMAEQGLNDDGRISLQEGPDGRAFIRLQLPFDRAWASLARALEKSSFEITDKDRSRGIYYARFLGPQDEDDEGWFDWLWGEDEHPLSGEMMRVEMVSQGPELMAISVRPENLEASLDRRQEQDILSLIKGNIN